MDAWALLSVSDKTGLTPLARFLSDAGLRLLATSSTARYLQEQGLRVESVEQLTGFGEILGGRVKTLHPMIYGGILASNHPEHQSQRQDLGAPDIRVVVVNLYPFEQALEQGRDEADLIEEIDIGGVSLIRAAAKNFERVAVLVSSDQYEAYMNTPFDQHTRDLRRELAQKAFDHVAYYDAVIGAALEGKPDVWPMHMVLAGSRQQELRYGENPHQSGAFYRYAPRSGLAKARVLQGKALSYNNLADVDTAVALAYDFEGPAAVAIKHQTPCAAALGSSVLDAYTKAHDADSVSIFGGVVAINRTLDVQLAERLIDIFLEVVIAPEVAEAALAVLSSKKNLRVLTIEPHNGSWGFDVKGIWGGFLVQPRDVVRRPPSVWDHVAGPVPGPSLNQDIELAWKVVARAKSNAIVVVKDGSTVGVASGETNRIDAARHALERAGQHARGAVLASDGFFPFDDVVRLAQECGVRTVVEPGGSIRDRDSIAAADAAGVTLLMTGERHFRH